MGLVQRRRKIQRRILDRRVEELGARSKPPQYGWLRAVREGLGLSAAQLAKRAGIGVSTLLEIEERERSANVMIGTVRRIARAMECDVVYAVVPEKATSFEEVLDARSKVAARRLIARTSVSMDLESQSVDPEETKAQTEELSQSLKEEGSRLLWEDE